MSYRPHTPSTRLGRRLSDAASHDVRADHDPWPLVAEHARRHLTADHQWRAQWWREGLKLAAATLVIVIIGVALAIAFRGTGEDVAAPGLTPVPTPSLPASPIGRVTTTLRVAVEGRIADADYGIWSPRPSEREVLRVLPEKATLMTVPLSGNGSGPTALVAGDTAVWLAMDRSIMRLDPLTNEVTATIPIDANPVALAIGHGSLWVAADEPLAVMRIDLTTNAVVATLSGVPRGTSMAIGDDAVWMLSTSGTQSTLTRIDPKTNRVAATVAFDSVDGEPEPSPCARCTGDIAAAGGSIWAVVPDRDALVQIDAASNSIVSVTEVGDMPSSVVVDSSGVWVGHDSDDGLYLVDPVSQRVIATTATMVIPPLSSVVARDGAIWGASIADGIIVRFDPERETK